MMEELVDELGRWQQIVMRSLSEEMREWRQRLLSGAFTPASLLYLAHSLGINLSGVSSLASADSFDPYRVLGLGKGDKDEDVKKRYRELLVKLHPDTAGTEGTGFLLQIVVAAYQQIAQERGWR